MRRRIQVAVVTLVVLIGAGVFFTIVRSTRNAAALSSCKNDLRSLGTGLANYASADRDRFPKATFGHSELPPEQRLSWIYELDPYIHARMDPEWTKYRNEPWNSEDNRRLARQRMLWVKCPNASDSTTADGYFLTTYPGATGVGSDAATYPKKDRRAGLFGYDRQIEINDIKDGLENTIAVIETSTDNGPWMAGGRPTSRPFELDGPNAIGKGGQFGGFHRGGMNVCFANFSVRFLHDSIDRELLAALFTIAGGEQVPALGDE